MAVEQSKAVVNPSLQRLLDKLKSSLGSLYGERLVGIYLYGSYARGEQDRESDVDVLIVLDRVERYAAEIDRVGPLIAKLSLELGASLSPVFLSEEAWKTSANPFVANLREQAVPA